MWAWPTSPYCSPHVPIGNGERYGDTGEAHEYYENIMVMQQLCMYVCMTKARLKKDVLTDYSPIKQYV